MYLLICCMQREWRHTQAQQVEKNKQQQQKTRRSRQTQQQTHTQTHTETHTNTQKHTDTLSRLPWASLRLTYKRISGHNSTSSPSFGARLLLQLLRSSANRHESPVASRGVALAQPQQQRVAAAKATTFLMRRLVASSPRPAMVCLALTLSVLLALILFLIFFSTLPVRLSFLVIEILVGEI